MFRCSGVQVFRCSGVQVFRGLLPKHHQNSTRRPPRDGISGGREKKKEQNFGAPTLPAPSPSGSHRHQKKIGQMPSGQTRSKKLAKFGQIRLSKCGQFGQMWCWPNSVATEFQMFRAQQLCECSVESTSSPQALHLVFPPTGLLRQTTAWGGMLGLSCTLVSDTAIPPLAVGVS